MRYTYTPLVLILLALLASSCDKEKTQVNAPPDLLNRDWFFAAKPDSAGFKAYQVTPVTSRFIDGFLFSSDRTFTRHTFAPNDAPLDIPGTWTTTNGREFHITPNNSQLAQYDIVIGTLTPTTLRAQVQP